MTGRLYYDGSTDRYDVLASDGSYYGGLHCGDCLEALLDGTWTPVRVEMSDDGWYLVGAPNRHLDGLRVRTTHE